MAASNSGRAGRRNGSISSVISSTAESPVWSRHGEEDGLSEPATPRDNHMASRATTARSYHAPSSNSEHDRQVPSPNAREESHFTTSLVAAGTSPSPDTTQTIEKDHPTTDMDIQMSETDLLMSELDYLREINAQMSERDVMHALYQLLDQLPGSQDVDLVDSFQRASLLPPITQESLAELEVHRVRSNPKLRHDVNFDKELHFRPNMDGSRGKQKSQSAEDYWQAILAELELYRELGTRLTQCHDAQQENQLTQMMKACQIRIPGAFETIKGILKTLVPSQDQAMVEERLDVTMIMQQISNGVFNLMDLVQWLATLLKIHCAPMRDDWIEQMVADTRKGVEEGCQKHVQRSLRCALHILEAMKLDIANHQIRQLRGAFIEHTVMFEQQHHLNRLHQGRLDLKRSRTWFKREASYVLARNSSANPLEIFTSALTRSLFSQSPFDAFPETFQFDAERLRTLQNDVSIYVQLDVCCDLFDVLVRDKVNEHVRETGKSTVRATLAVMFSDTRRFADNAANIAAEIVRSVLLLQGSSTCHNSELADFVEKRLRVDLQSSSVAFSMRVHQLMEENTLRFSSAVQGNLRLSLLALHEAMLSSTHNATSILPNLRPRPTSTAGESAMHEILRRATHMAVIHWHIWSPIVYNVQEHEGSAATDSSQPTSTGGPDSGASEDEDFESADHESAMDSTADLASPDHSSWPAGCT